MGAIVPLLGFAGPQPSTETVQYSTPERHPGHAWSRSGKAEVWKRRRLGPGAGFEEAVAGIMRDGVFIPLPEAFPEDFPKKR